MEDALDEMRPGLAGMKVDTSIFRPADYIEKAIDNLTLAVIVGVAAARARALRASCSRGARH